jgi:hypothetical protein
MREVPEKHLFLSYTYFTFYSLFNTVLQYSEKKSDNSTNVYGFQIIEETVPILHDFL